MTSGQRSCCWGNPRSFEIMGSVRILSYCQHMPDLLLIARVSPLCRSALYQLHAEPDIRRLDGRAVSDCVPKQGHCPCADLVARRRDRGNAGVQVPRHFKVVKAADTQIVGDVDATAFGLEQRAGGEVVVIAEHSIGVWRLRKKIGTDRIETVRGLGYRLVAPVARPVS